MSDFDHGLDLSHLTVWPPQPTTLAGIGLIALAIFQPELAISALVAGLVAIIGDDKTHLDRKPPSWTLHASDVGPGWASIAQQRRSSSSSRAACANGFSIRPASTRRHDFLMPQRHAGSLHELQKSARAGPSWPSTPKSTNVVDRVTAGCRG